MREVTRVVCGRVLCRRNAGLGYGSGISMGLFARHVGRAASGRNGWTQWQQNEGGRLKHRLDLSADKDRWSSRTAFNVQGN
jgi:hypothetical protein